MSRREPQLRKSTGEQEAFNPRKLQISLTRSGAEPEQVREIVDAVEDRMRDGMATTEIYRIAHRLLRRERRAMAARYSLQRAIQQLGPDGIPFERFVAELWKCDGFRAKSSVRLKGRLVRHEIDVLAKKGNDARFAECKFRAQDDGKVDVKVALYMHARASDLRAIYPTASFWLITNGRFTRDALTYGQGVGLKMLAWDHPRGQSLREHIDRAGLHPVTALSTLQRKEQLALLRAGVVLAATLQKRPKLLDQLEMSDRRRDTLEREIADLCD
ncbi:MAG: ATP cone domain-containing protein [bacterium]|nr:ATP cone domain-containing protein [bacterium]